MTIKKIENNIFKFIAIIFVTILFYYIIHDGLTHGVLKTIFIWAFTVIGTPIPFAGILLSFPLHVFFNITMAYTQIFLSIVAIIIIIYYTSYIQDIFDSNFTIGNIYKKIISQQLYIIFLISIISSVLLTQIVFTTYIYKQIKYDNEHIIKYISVILLNCVYWYNIIML